MSALGGPKNFFFFSFFTAVEPYSNLATLTSGEETNYTLCGQCMQDTHSFVFARASWQLAQDSDCRHSLVCAVLITQVRLMGTMLWRCPLAVSQGAGKMPLARHVDFTMKVPH